MEKIYNRHGYEVRNEFAQLGKLVSLARNIRGISQLELAARSKVPVDHIRGIERGSAARVSFDTLCAIQGALGIELEQLEGLFAIQNSIGIDMDRLMDVLKAPAKKYRFYLRWNSGYNESESSYSNSSRSDEVVEYLSVSDFKKGLLKSQNLDVDQYNILCTMIDKFGYDGMVELATRIGDGKLDTEMMLRLLNDDTAEDFLLEKLDEEYAKHLINLRNSAKWDEIENEVIEKLKDFPAVLDSYFCQFVRDTFGCNLSRSRVIRSLEEKQKSLAVVYLSAGEVDEFERLKNSDELIRWVQSDIVTRYLYQQWQQDEVVAAAAAAPDVEYEDDYESWNVFFWKPDMSEDKDDLCVSVYKSSYSSFCDD